LHCCAALARLNESASAGRGRTMQADDDAFGVDGGGGGNKTL
jgi:hypothetical protein